MGWVPPGHTSTSVGVSMYVSVCWTTFGLISYRINTASTVAIVLLVDNHLLDYCKQGCNGPLGFYYFYYIFLLAIIHKYY